mmetsp:Transcript_2319/g.6082  ORF Transcript_2319/g.6082 Transcript_2319/m.6082 type:complete len:226 (+) Transcript_2319:91-768(+)
MLAADKLLLQSNVKQRSIALREKELRLFNTNFSAVGTQAAIMAGFTLTSFVEIDLPPNKPTAKTMLHTFVTLSICSNFVCVAMVTFVSVWGTGKALRGRDGAMDTAVDGMNAERTLIFSCFAMGVLATLGCLFSAAWVLMETEIAIVSSVIVGSTMYLVVSEARRIRTLFFLDKADEVSFDELRDIFPESWVGTEPPRSPPPRPEGMNASPKSARGGSRQRTNVD